MFVLASAAHKKERLSFPTAKKKALYSMIANAPKGINFHTMREVFGLENENSKNRLKDTLENLKSHGHIRYDRSKQRYFATRPTSPLMVARAKVTEQGIELTPVKWTQSKATKPYMIVKKTDTEYKHVKDGDKVLVAIQATKSHIRDRKKTLVTNCAVLQILEHGQPAQIRATFHQNAKGGPAISPAYKMARGLDFPVKFMDFEGPYALEDYPEGAEILFRVDEKISQHGLGGTVVDLARWKKEYPASLLSQRDKFSSGFLDNVYTQEQEIEAARITKSAPEPAHYEDLRSVIQFAVDPEDAKDRDDAISAIRDTSPDNLGGFIVTVSNIDVVRLAVQSQDILETTLRHPLTAYTNEGAIHMLPKAWAEDAASLVNKEDRFCITAEIRIDAQGEKIDHRIFRSLNAPYQTSYSTFDTALINGKAAEFSPEMIEAAQVIYDAYEALSIEETRREPLSFKQARYYVEKDDHGRIKGVHSEMETGGISKDIIEKFMVICNLVTREECAKLEAQTIDRIEDAPNIHERLPRNITNTNKEAQFLNRIWTRAEIRKTLDEHADDPAMLQAISDLLIRKVMRPGRFTTTEVGHFGMGLEDTPYASFSTSVRSLASLVNQMSLSESMGWTADYTTPERREWLNNNFLSPQAMESIADHINGQQPFYKRLQRDALKRLSMGHLNQYEGKTVSACFQHVTEKDISLKLEDCARPFLLPLSAIAGANFSADVPNQQIIARDSGRIVRASEWMQMKLIKADPLDNRLVVSIPEHQPRIAKIPFKHESHVHTFSVMAHVLEATTKALKVKIGNKTLDWSTKFPGSRTQRKNGLYHYNTGLTLTPGKEQCFRIRLSNTGEMIDAIPAQHTPAKINKRREAFYKAQGIDFEEKRTGITKKEWMDVIKVWS